MFGPSDEYGERLYPKPVKYRTSGFRKQWDARRFRVDYILTYEGGQISWSGYYETKLLARVAAFYQVNVASWGGGAVLHDLRGKNNGAYS